MPYHQLSVASSLPMFWKAILTAPVVTDGGNLQPVTEALENVVPGLRVCCDSRDGLCRRWSAERDQQRDKRRQVMSLHFAMFHDLRPCGRIQPKYRVEGFPNHFFSDS